MHISHIKISNILGIQEIDFSPGKFTAITGANGSGKTSILEAIKGALKGGHDGTLLRAGADKGEIVLILDNGTQISKRVTQTGSETRVLQDGKKAARPADIIKSVTDSMSVNPVAFLAADKKDRVNILLESMPVEIDPALLTEISGVGVDHELASAGLAAIDAVRKIVYDDRTGTNRAVKEKTATIGQLRATLPDHLQGAIHEDIDDLMAQLNAMDATKDDELNRIDQKLARLRKEHEDTIAILQRQIDEAKAAFSETERKAEAKRLKTVTDHSAARQGLADRLTAIQEAQKAAARFDQTRDTIKAMEHELEELTVQAENQNNALADLDKYKSELLANLPIPGLEVVDGEILRNGVQFDRLNTAQKVGIAVDIAKLRAGDLGVVCVDGLELMDDAHFKEFRDAAIKSGLQMFVTRVGDGEFQVTGE